MTKRNIDRAYETTNSIGMKFVALPNGEFVMGSPESEEARSENETQHRVLITKPCMMGVHPVTQAQWRTVMGTNPSKFKGGNLPVEQVSWLDAMEFCRELSKQEGRKYRLPTEAEWEYACRAGTTTPFHCGPTISTRQANYAGEESYNYGPAKQPGVFRGKPTPVGSFPANAWGLFDMHGNVWEWCADWCGWNTTGYGPDDKWDSTQEQEAGWREVDPKGPDTGTSRVQRGGSWDSEPQDCRAASRSEDEPDKRSSTVGFRVLREVDADDTPFLGNRGLPVQAKQVAEKARPKPALPRKPAVFRYREFTNTIGMKFASIPAGEFLMGSPESEEGRLREETQHRVVITKPFRMGIHPVTQAQWRAVMGGNPSEFKGRNLPVEQVSWEDAMAFCRKLSEMERNEYRLPTEAEWEYACRAGTTTRFSFGDTISRSQANYQREIEGNPREDALCLGEPMPVGSFPANPWGLFDMHGNVWEWCADWYGPYPRGEAVEPKGPGDGTERVQRGGSWANDPLGCRAAFRCGEAPDVKDSSCGFRVVLDSR